MRSCIACALTLLAVVASPVAAAGPEPRMVATWAGDGYEANATSFSAIQSNVAVRRTVSSDGRFVAFSSAATNLVAGQEPVYNNGNVYLRDRLSGHTVLVSHVPGQPLRPGNDTSVAVALSRSGRFVLFDSFASDLTAAGVDQNQQRDVFLYDRIDGSVAAVSLNAIGSATGNFDSTGCDVSDDGDVVLFNSNASNLVTGFVNSHGNGSDVYRRARSSATTTLVSHRADMPLTTANSYARGFGLSADGRYALFSSEATDLVAGVTDANSSSTDHFVFDQAKGANVLASHFPADPLLAAGNGFQFQPVAFSTDGRYALMPGLLFDRVSGATEALALGPGGFAGAMSDDARIIAYGSSDAGNLAGVIDSNGGPDAFLLDRMTGVRTLLSHRAGAATETADSFTLVAGISADGARVALTSKATNLVPLQVDVNDDIDVFLSDTATAANILVSGASGSSRLTLPQASLISGLSANGQLVTFDTQANNVVPSAFDHNASSDVFAFDAATSTVDAVSPAAVVRPAPSRLGARCEVSADGRWCLLVSQSPEFTPSTLDTANSSDVYLVDIDGGSRTLVTHAPGDPVQATGAGLDGLLSSDGRFAALAGIGGVLLAGESNPSAQGALYLYDRDIDRPVLVTHAAGAALVDANGSSGLTAISPDGRYVLFYSYATNLVPGQLDNSFTVDTFLFDRDSGNSVLVSGSAGSPSVAGNGDSRPLAVSADGRYVVFTSTATDLLPMTTLAPSSNNVYQRDLGTGITRLVSHLPGDPTHGGSASAVAEAMTPDGRYIVLISAALDFGATGGSPGELGAYVWDRDIDLLQPIQRPVSQGGGGLPPVRTDISPDGRFVIFGSAGSSVVPGESGAVGTIQSYLRDRRNGTTVLASHALGSPTMVADSDAIPAALSSDGACVLFGTTATNLTTLGGVFGATQLYRYCRDSGITLITPSVRRTNSAANGSSFAAPASLPRGGDRIVFASVATDLDPAVVDLNLSSDAFVVDRPSTLFADGFD